ncbi:hypothetical protein DQ04_01441100 [Trypanosoma grayi]|uniref:hypothetical protein n=1 Tax=Trypanosoma grayi TaxID=71804 RepID=UPI0004F4B668|nr:hypothetical protein DQ04_01441100 [Trypanosoma grayi]KEG12764.1 hypothetical protein DQ04_01441100 [Trypanosoma grayi]
MEAVAEQYFSSGDMKAAATFYCNLMVLHPRYVKMARICRVLADPSVVPQPHRYADVVEALLEPTITPEALFGADLAPADINKAYQRWTLLVHPDKNPYPRAKDAFNRLVALKTVALEAASKPKELLSTEPTAWCGGTRRRTRQHGKSDIPAAPQRPGESGSSSPRAAEIDMTLSELKKVQVTLKSLKRKDIDDSELPELSATLRNVRERRFCSRPPSPLAFSAPSVLLHVFAPEINASHAPSVPPQSCSSASDAPTTSALPPLSANNSPPETKSVREAPRCVSTAKPLRHTPPETGTEEQSQESPPVKIPSHCQHSGNDKTTEIVTNGQASKENALKSEESLPEKLPSRRGTGGNGETKEAVNDERATNKTKEKPQESSTVKSHLRHQVANRERVKKTVINQPTKEEVASEKLQVVSPSSSPTGLVDEGGASLVDAAKGSIRDLIRGLQEMKASRAPLRLRCDLTFASYEREKLQQELAGSKMEVMP